MELFRAICQYGGVKKKWEKSSLSTAVAKEVPPLKTRTHPRSYSYLRRKLNIASKHQNFIRSKKLAPQEENTYPDSRMHCQESLATNDHRRAPGDGDSHLEDDATTDVPYIDHRRAPGDDDSHLEDHATTDVPYITRAVLTPTVLSKNQEQGQLREKSSKPAVPFCIALSRLSSLAQVRAKQVNFPV